MCDFSCLTDLSGLAFGESPKKSIHAPPPPIPEEVTPTALQQPPQTTSSSSSFFTAETSAAPIPATERQQQLSQDVCGGDQDELPIQPSQQQRFFASGPDDDLLGGVDPDTSVHEIHIDDRELEQFDEEFSDLDTTAMTESEDQNYTDGAVRHNLFSVQHPLNPRDLQLHQDEGDAPGMDYCDVQRHLNQGEGQEQNQQQLQQQQGSK